MNLQNKTIAIIGLGYVGLPLAVEFGKVRPVIAFDINEMRVEELKRGASMAKCFGLEVQTLTPSEIASMWPGVTVSDVVGGVYLPKDGRTNPIDTTQALAKGTEAFAAARMNDGIRKALSGKHIGAM